MSKLFTLAGCGGHARSIADVIISNDLSDGVLFVDAHAREGEKIMGFDVVAHFPENTRRVVPASGNNMARAAISQQYCCESVIANTAHIGLESVVEEGCFIAHSAHVGPRTTIGRASIINTQAVVEHDVRVGNYCHVAPHSTICGECKLGDDVFVGAGSVIKQCISICSHVIIGAGAVVCKDITREGTYVGCPARRIGSQHE